MNSADRIEAFNFIVVPPLRILTFVWLRCSKARFQSLNILLHNVCAKWQIPKTVITPAWQFWWKFNEEVFECTIYLWTLFRIVLVTQETLFWTSSNSVSNNFYKVLQNLAWFFQRQTQTRKKKMRESGWMGWSLKWTCLTLRAFMVDGLALAFSMRLLN